MSKFSIYKFFFKKQFFKRETLQELNRRLDKKMRKLIKKEKWIY